MWNHTSKITRLTSDIDIRRLISDMTHQTSDNWDQMSVIRRLRWHVWPQMFDTRCMNIRRLTSDIRRLTSDVLHQTSATRHDMRHHTYHTLDVWHQIRHQMYEHQTSDIRRLTTEMKRLTSNIWRLTSDVELQTSEIRRQTSDVWHLTWDVWHETSEIGCVTSDVWHQTSELTYFPWWRQHCRNVVVLFAIISV